MHGEKQCNLDQAVQRYTILAEKVIGVQLASGAGIDYVNSAMGLDGWVLRDDGKAFSCSEDMSDMLGSYTVKVAGVCRESLKREPRSMDWSLAQDNESRGAYVCDADEGKESTPAETSPTGSGTGTSIGSELAAEGVLGDELLEEESYADAIRAEKRQESQQNYLKNQKT
nr:hypothetical protein Iba_chr09bCG12410 [Ipomoea batatas]